MTNIHRHLALVCTLGVIASTLAACEASTMQGPTLSADRTAHLEVAPDPDPTGADNWAVEISPDGRQLSFHAYNGSAYLGVVTATLMEDDSIQIVTQGDAATVYENESGELSVEASFFEPPSLLEELQEDLDDLEASVATSGGTDGAAREALSYNSVRTGAQCKTAVERALALIAPCKFVLRMLPDARVGVRVGFYCREAWTQVVPRLGDASVTPPADEREALCYRADRGFLVDVQSFACSETERACFAELRVGESLPAFVTASPMEVIARLGGWRQGAVSMPLSADRTSYTVRVPFDSTTISSGETFTMSFVHPYLGDITIGH